MEMRGIRWLAPILLTALIGSGCQGTSMRRPGALASAEPSLNTELGSPSTVVEVPAAQGITIVDRHPLFSKPREYYENSGDNRFVKTASATLIGIPAGIVGELRQIVAGRPPAASY